MYSSLYFAILSLVECLFLSGSACCLPHTVDFFYPSIPFRRVGDKSRKHATCQQNDAEDPSWFTHRSRLARRSGDATLSRDREQASWLVLLRSLLGPPGGPCLLQHERGQGYAEGKGAHRLRWPRSQDLPWTEGRRALCQRSPGASASRKPADARSCQGFSRFIPRNSRLSQPAAGPGSSISTRSAPESFLRSWKTMASGMRMPR